MISEFKISKALLDYLASVDYLPEISVDGIKFDDEIPKTYLREFVLPAGSSNIGTEPGSTERYDGIYQIDVLTPKGEGKWQNLKICDEIKELFPFGLVLENGAQKLTVTGFNRSQSRNEGNQYVTSNSVNFVSFSR